MSQSHFDDRNLPDDEELSFKDKDKEKEKEKEKLSEGERPDFETNRLREMPDCCHDKTKNAYKAIKYYQNLTRKRAKNRLGLFSAVFNNTKKLRRARAYQQLLKNSNTEFQKLIIIYALLSSNSGEGLRNTVALNMGYESPEAAKSWLKNIIHRQLKMHDGEYDSNSLIKDIEEKIVPGIAKATNQNRDYCNNDYIKVINKLKKIARTAGYLDKKKIPDSLQVNKNDELFIAICKYKKHSFIVVGIHDKGKNENHILCAMGKGFIKDKYPNDQDIFEHLMRSLFTSYDAGLMEEAYLYEPVKRSLTYKAFSINRGIYNEFLALVSFLSKYKLKAYQYAEDMNSDDTNTAKYVYKDIPRNSDNDERFNEIYNTLIKRIDGVSLMNNCRHTAIGFLDAMLKKEYTTHGISTYYASDLPFSISSKSGKLIGNIFILPTPPTQSLAKEKREVLTRIYRQLERISKKYHNNKYTYKKFSVLKQLYMDIQGENKDSIIEIFKAINDWKIDPKNAKLVDKRRGFSLFSSTATRTMLYGLDKLENKYHNR